MIKELDFIIGNSSNYDPVKYKNSVYICNDTMKAFIPTEDKEEIKNTGWIECEFNQAGAGNGIGRASAKQVGDIVSITGYLKYGNLRDGDLAFTIPEEIDIPYQNIDLDFHQKGSAEKNRGCRLRLTKNRNIIIANEYSYSGDIIYFNFNYII